jgi:transcription antitermination factor NusG
VLSNALTLRNLDGRTNARKMDFPIAEIMRRRGLTPFIPTESIFIRNDRYYLGNKRRVQRALIPGLVFLHLEEPVNWLWISGIPMVHGIFGFRGVPYRFARDGIERLVAISDDLRQPDYYRPMPTRRAYQVGDQVIDLSGLIEGTIEVAEIKGEMARVLVPFFGHLREVTTRASSLAKA